MQVRPIISKRFINCTLNFNKSLTVLAYETSLMARIQKYNNQIIFKKHVKPLFIFFTCFVFLQEVFRLLLTFFSFLNFVWVIIAY